MPFYWSTHSIPEMSSVPKSERGPVWREAWKRAGWNWRTSLGTLTVMAVAMPVAFHNREIATALGLGKTGEFLVFMTSMIAGQLVGQQVTIWAIRPYLREVIGGLCVHCGYDLRASPERCPECGQAAHDSVPTQLD